MTSTSCFSVCWACATASPYPGTMITRSAYASRIATSAGLADRTGRSLAVNAPRVDPPFSAPNIVLITERPIARAIKMVSRVPDAPTRMPAISSRVLPSRKPEAATVMPVNALSSEMTMGTSAPPTGSTSRTPSPAPTIASSTPMNIEGATQITTAKPSADSTPRPHSTG